MSVLLLASVFVIATCGLVYELIAGALASYLLGDSITQFSTIIGCYLSAMGVGSWLSRYFKRNLITTFIQVELLIALVGGFSAAILFSTFEFITQFRFLLYFLVALTGILVGLEIPLLMRILKDKLEFEDLVSKVFTFDYLGALIASLLFPMVLVPQLGLIRSAFLFGLFNAAVALWALMQFSNELRWPKLLKGAAVVVIALLSLGFVYSTQIMSFSETAAFQDPIIFSKTTKYQRIVLTKSKSDLKLFLNGNLQFSARDEYRYHEALVHVGMGAIGSHKKILILGGGDGLALREVLKYADVESITLVDLDRAMTELFSTHDPLKKLNHSSLNDPRAHIVSADAYSWLRQNKELFDFAIVDFPDPSNFSLGKLYSSNFFKELKKALAPEGACVVQSTSPYYAKKSYWIINETIASTGLITSPYHAYVPSFGEWGFILASREGLHFDNSRYPEGLRFVSAEQTPNMFAFPSDMLSEFREINRLNNQILVRTFEDEWSEFIHQ